MYKLYIPAILVVREFSICFTLSVCLEMECVNFPLASQSKFREKIHINECTTDYVITCVYISKNITVDTWWFREFSICFTLFVCME